jgi:hypothetical protein
MRILPERRAAYIASLSMLLGVSGSVYTNRGFYVLCTLFALVYTAKTCQIANIKLHNKALNASAIIAFATIANILLIQAVNDNTKSKLINDFALAFSWQKNLALIATLSALAYYLTIYYSTLLGKIRGDASVDEFNLSAKNSAKSELWQLPNSNTELIKKLHDANINTFTQLSSANIKELAAGTGIYPKHLGRLQIVAVCKTKNIGYRGLYPLLESTKIDDLKTIKKLGATKSHALLIKYNKRLNLVETVITKKELERLITL